MVRSALVIQSSWLSKSNPDLIPGSLGPGLPSRVHEPCHREDAPHHRADLAGRWRGGLGGFFQRATSRGGCKHRTSRGTTRGKPKRTETTPWDEQTSTTETTRLVGPRRRHHRKEPGTRHGICQANPPIQAPSLRTNIGHINSLLTSPQVPKDPNQIHVLDQKSSKSIKQEKALLPSRPMPTAKTIK